MSDGGIAPAPYTVALRPPPAFSSRVLVWGAGLGLVLHYASLRTDFVHTDIGLQLPPLLFGAVGALLFALVRFLALPKQIAPIVFFADRIELPIGPSSRRQVIVDYSDVFSIDVLGRPGREELVIATRSRLFVFPLIAFVDSKRLLALPSVLRQRLVLRPNGAALIAALEDRQRVAYFAFRRSPRVTQALLAVLVGVFLFETLANAVEQPLVMLRFGANAPILVRAGQWYRLLTGNFLHANLIHLAFNGLALYSLGAVLESVLGSSRFFVLYLVAAAGGALASAWYAQGLYSVGASTAMFGLLGALLYLNVRSYSQLPTGIRQTSRFWVFILGINFSLTFLVPVVDVAGHLGGFVTGVIGMALFYIPWKTQIVLPTTTASRALAIAAGMVTLLAAAEGAQRASMSPVADAVALLSELDNKPDASPFLLNDLAMGVATTPNVDAAALQLAERLAERAAATLPSEAAVLDTLATVRFRTGAIDDAIDLEERALTLRTDPFLWAQLARFWAAKKHPVGVSGADPNAIVLQPRRHVDGSFAVTVKLTHDIEDPHGWKALLVAEGARPYSTVVLRLGAGEARTVELELDRINTATWPEEVQLRVLVVEGGVCECEADSLSVELFDYPPEVAAYPGPDTK